MKKVIKKIAIKLLSYLGIMIVKLEKQSAYKSISKASYIINENEAKSALKSVDRKRLKAFEYFERPKASSPQLDKLENDWWNLNSEIVEKTWVSTEDISNIVRKEYVTKAQNFFLQINKSEIKVLDIGCGSGWFGRMIVNEKIKCVGIDFSQSQIDIAIKRKNESNYHDSLNYHCISNLDDLKNLDEFDGIICNAFLHHLYTNELEDLFSSIKKHFNKGCKIFIFEPVFYNLVNPKGDSALLNVYNNLLDAIRIKAINENDFDLDTYNALYNIIYESENHGFFYSPKEVPFTISEIFELLNKYCIVENNYFVNTLNFNASNILGLIMNQENRLEYSKIVFPAAFSINNYLTKEGFLPDSYKGYLFTCFECSIK